MKGGYFDWTVEQVCQWLRSINMDEQIVECFNSGNITGRDLAILSVTSLKNLGIQALGVWKEIIHQIRAMD